VLLRDQGGLADIAPTILEILNLPKPATMSGASLVLPAGTTADACRIPQTLGV